MEINTGPFHSNSADNNEIRGGHMRGGEMLEDLQGKGGGMMVQ